MLSTFCNEKRLFVTEVSGRLVEFSDWSAWLSKFDLLSKVVFNVLPNFLV